jgi:hypothetical protein
MRILQAKFVLALAIDCSSQWPQKIENWKLEVGWLADSHVIKTACFLNFWQSPQAVFASEQRMGSLLKVELSHDAWALPDIPDAV